MDYKIFWTEEAIRNLEEIIDYLSNTWSEREVIRFKEKLGRIVIHIRSNPLMFPRSEFQPRLRKAVLSKQVSVFYEIREQFVYLVYIFVNYKSTRKLK